jgi:hypothetical protein
MFARKTILALVMFTSLGTAALAPTSASAWGHWGAIGVDTGEAIGVDTGEAIGVAGGATSGVVDGVGADGTVDTAPGIGAA